LGRQTPRVFPAVDGDQSAEGPPARRRDPWRADAALSLQQRLRKAHSLHAAIFRSAGANARILAIEPQPEIFERLVYNIRQNPFASIKAIDCAVADVDAEITLFVDDDNRGETSMRIINNDSVGAHIRVPAKTLRNIIAEEGFERIDAIKLDVEGAEDLILEPFFNETRESLWPQLLLIEFAPERWAIDLPALLAARGYRRVLRTRHKAVYERK
jgi:FkbM family methyltransferase